MPDDVVTAVKEELRRRGVDYTLHTRGRHTKIRFAIAGVPKLLVCSRSSSDYHAAKNTIALIRRMYRDGNNAPPASA